MEKTKLEDKQLNFNLIDRNNLKSFQLLIQHCISKAHHISLDCEFTGLGDKSRSSNVEDRFRQLAQVVKTHALVALGLTVFESTDVKHTYVVHNFQFMMLSRQSFLMSPRSCQFLAENGFDFNHQLKNGILYAPGNESSKPDDNQKIMRNLFMCILNQNVPVIVHNGLLDLMFVYHSFYAEIPSELLVFVADLNEMFKAGIYDTKYIADFVTREKTSFLAYLFRKCERLQDDSAEHVVCYIRDRIVPFLPNEDKPKQKHILDTGKPFCEQYASHGFCNNGKECEKSHDLDLILDDEQLKKRKRSKVEATVKERAIITEPVQKSNAIKYDKNMDSGNITKHVAFEIYHSACFDAYMTGYIFSHQNLTYSSNIEDHKNKLYLIGKERPLLIEKSRFACTSKGHQRARMSGN